MFYVEYVCSTVKIPKAMNTVQKKLSEIWDLEAKLGKIQDLGHTWDIVPNFGPH